MQPLIILSSLRPAPDVNAQPTMVLAHWRVFMDAGGERFLAGILPNQATLRITSPIQAIDLVSRTWLTKSGRVYETPARPTESVVLRQVLALLMRTEDPTAHPEDVTDTVWAGMQCAVQ